MHSVHLRAHGEQLIELERREASERATLEEQAQAIHDASLTQRAADAVAEVGMRAASELQSQAEAADQRVGQLAQTANQRVAALTAAALPS